MAVETRPVIAITIGDPAGIGPEVVVKALAEKDIYNSCRPFVIGESGAIQAAIALSGKNLALHPIEKAAETKGKFGTIDILDMHNLDWGKVKMGEMSADCGRAAMEFLQMAMQLALNREITAMVNAPINKEATMLAGYTGLGHLEYLAQATQTKTYATMLATGNLRCVHLTTHYSLKEACDKVKKDFILSRLKLTDDSFRQWGFGKPVIGVAALNPMPAKTGCSDRKKLKKLPRQCRKRSSLASTRAGRSPPILFLTGRLRANLTWCW